MNELLNSAGFGLINAIIGLANLVGLIYLHRRPRSLTRQETKELLIFRDKDGYLINTVKK